MKITNNQIEFRNSDDYIDDEKFFKVINAIIDNKDRQIKQCNILLQKVIKDSFIMIDNEKLNVIKHKIKNIIELSFILIEKITNLYQVSELSLDEIKDELLKLSDNQEYKKDIEKYLN